VTIISSYPDLTSWSAMDNTCLINDRQWWQLAQLSLRNNLPVQEQLEQLHIEAVNPNQSDAVRLVGWLILGPSYRLYGCIDETGCLNT
jgi:hypothetical protein